MSASRCRLTGSQTLSQSFKSVQIHTAPLATRARPQREKIAPGVSYKTQDPDIKSGTKTGPRCKAGQWASDAKPGTRSKTGHQTQNRLKLGPRVKLGFGYKCGHGMQNWASEDKPTSDAKPRTQM